ncbi:MAG: DUF1573 domain-containing protein [bacterium]|nr:DUF1573 domain-containing protein [bacterium]
MTKKWPYLFLVFLVLISLGVYGYFKATSGEAAAGPRIEVEPKNFDFGGVLYGEIVETNFIVKNQGKEILEIKRIGTSCSCTTAKVDKPKINPGENAQILVSYDTGAMGEFHGKGKQERIIYVRSNDPENPQTEVIISADVQ